ncbi:MAG: sulfatase [Verrucomicrobiales bacterium]|nr:sulfatase [Verrucomicrobiales bacterium]
MMPRSFHLVITLIPLLFSTTAGYSEEEPNILFILADDLGWADPGCYNHPLFETPNLDQLAADGMRFTQAYAAAPICSASRAAILTGNSTARNRFEFVVKDEVGYQPMQTPLRAPAYTVDLSLDAITIPESIAQTGRETAFFGKWHLNAHYGRYLGWSPTHGPTRQGFQHAREDFGSHPYGYWKDKKLRSFDKNIESGTFPEDSMTQEAIQFLKEDHTRPFFLMVSHFYVHDPNHTRLRWLYDHYLNQLPTTRENRERVAHYGAMVTTLDHHVGELLKGLEEAGKADSTLVVFTSDNGGHPNYAGNAPLRGSKWNLYEGGIRVPFIARWPGHIPDNTINRTPICSTDLFPTFAGITGADHSTAEDGISLLPLFKDPEAPLRERQFVWHFPYYHPESNYELAPEEIGINDGYTTKTKPQSAIRVGDWKLIRFHENDNEELYDLSSDLTESSDLADTRPDIRKRLSKQLTDYLEEANARFATANPDSKE